jgi:hypothetical protein
MLLRAGCATLKIIWAHNIYTQSNEPRTKAHSPRGRILKTNMLHGITCSVSEWFFLLVLTIWWWSDRSCSRRSTTITDDQQQTDNLVVEWYVPWKLIINELTIWWWSDLSCSRRSTTIPVTDDQQQTENLVVECSVLWQEINYSWSTTNWQFGGGVIYHVAGDQQQYR